MRPGFSPRIAPMLAALVAIVGVVSCGSPTGPSVVSTPGSFLGSLQPANGDHIESFAQPVTITITRPPGSAMAEVVVDVATTTDFGSPVFSQAAELRSGDTTSIPLNILPPDATYHWRTRPAGGGATGDGSLSSPVMSFRIGPAFTAGRYSLRLGLGTACSSFQLAGRPYREFQVDGTLSTSGRNIQFGVSLNDNYRPTPLALTLSQEGHRVSGALYGDSPDLPQPLQSFYLAVWAHQQAGGRPSPALATGTWRYDGSAQGTFEGSIWAIWVVWGDGEAACDAAGSTWTLTPIR